MSDPSEQPDETDESLPAPGFEPPHPNGAAHRPPPGKRRRAPWEFTVLALFVALICIAIILGWTLVGSHSPERLDDASAVELAMACTTAQTKLKALPNSDPRDGAAVVARVRAENGVLRAMTTSFADVHPPKSTPAAAVRGWTDDWTRVIDARERFASDLEATRGTDKKVQFVMPASKGIKPVSGNMDDYVRENHPNIDPCFTTALQLETVEGPRTYEKVTQ